MGPMTPLGALARGIVSGAVGTLAMDLVLYLRYRRGGGEQRFADFEFSSGLDSWDQAPAPAQVGKRLLEGFLQREEPASRARLVDNVMHWGYGLAWGAQYGIVAGSFPTPPVRSGLAFGSLIWLSDYVVLPLAKLYKPIWEYDGKTLAEDLGAHLAYSVGTTATFRLLTRNA